MSVPYWSISTFYFFYFAALGGMLPYWGLFLKDKGFSSVEIGELIGVLAITKIISPNLWSWLSDRIGHEMPIIRWSSLLSFVVFLGVFYSQSYWAMMAVMLLFSFFWNATLPQFEANTFSHLKQNQAAQYSLIRVWGSIGFILAVLLGGALVDHYGVSIVPRLLSGLFLGIFISSLLVPQALRNESKVIGEKFWHILKKKAVITILLIAFLIQLSHGAYYSFYSIYLEQFNYSKSLIGTLWSLAVLAEVVVFVLMQGIIKNLGIHRMLMLSLILSSARWLIIAQGVEHLSLLVFAQLLHAASFGIVHVVCVYIISQYFKGNYKSRGQALYASIGFGVGGALGSYLAGFYWDQWGGDGVFLLFSLFAASAIFVFLKWANFQNM